MFSELQNKQSHALEMVQSLFLRLLVSLIRMYGCATRIVEDPSQHRSTMLSLILRQALDYVHADSGNLHTIDELALLVHTSRSHLMREFKRSMGVPLGQYMRSLCLERARLCLIETNDPISVIAERLSFSSIHTFSIFFKRHMGVSPQEYRRRFCK
ncbi:helix-turn-helix domain-containing protein [Dictyobacter aurantiacus]|uniref:HTH araC/xylS-type domain-containing protein n=1 Tax=Dictyobacter aurantiacus TaxID=1936993 RepID=A0A401ZR41_9CHLR|nr:AraC family transcriptional regulator [Dictyobacter aurantiacus]GCE09335.1 hypothetical protein KDAU_66640 [Dictyobacter aurantiacus]